MISLGFLFIGTTEVMFVLLFVLLVVVLVFGADYKKLQMDDTEIARGLGKGMHTLKNASSDLKHEITKFFLSAKEQGMDDSAAKEIKDEIQKVKDDLEDFTGSIKRNI